MKMFARLTIGAVAALVLATVVAACGGDSETPAKAPRIPAAIADRLASLSDETAAALEVGDDCAAQETADELESEALEAESEIPQELRRQVREGVQQLTASISCEPVPVIETVPEETTTTEEPACPEDKHGKGGEDDSGGETTEALPPGQAKKADEDPCKQKDEEEDEGGGEEDDGGISGSGISGSSGPGGG